MIPTVNNDPALGKDALSEGDYGHSPARKHRYFTRVWFAVEFSYQPRGKTRDFLSMEPQEIIIISALCH